MTVCATRDNSFASKAGEVLVIVIVALTAVITCQDISLQLVHPRVTAICTIIN